jgi:hypothetical protein
MTLSLQRITYPASGVHLQKSNPIAHAHVNLFADTYKPIPVRILTLAEALDEIRTGVYAAPIAYVRRMLARGEPSYRAAKNKLPAFTFAGTFAPSRSIPHLQQHTGIVHGDLDHIPDVAATMQALAADPHTVYVFVSPSGTGLKLGVRGLVVTDDAAYKHAWQAVADAYRRLYGVRWDASGKDVSRLCYVSDDPELYINPEAAVFDVSPAPPRPPRPRPTALAVSHTPTARQDYAQRAINTATTMIQSAPMGTRHHTRLKAARLLGGYVAGGLLSYEQALSALSRALDGYTEDISGALKTVVDGLAYGEAHPITLHALEAEREAWIASHRATPTPQAPVEDNPWAGMRTLSLKPYGGYRGLYSRMRGKGATHGHS